MISLNKYNKQKKTISLYKVNLLSFLFILPISCLMILIFYIIRGSCIPFDLFIVSLRNKFNNYYILLFIILLGILVHEFIHGIVWSYFSKKGIKSLKIGLSIKTLTPYCHCTEPLKIIQYKIGILSPFIILGFIPYIISIVIENIDVLILSIFFSIASIGDFFILFIIRNEKSTSYILDHDSEVGCYILKKK